MSELAHALPSWQESEPIRRLVPVERPARRRPKRIYGVVAVAGAVAIALAQMVLSILTTQGSFELAELTQQQRQLTYQTQILYDDVAGLGSPQYLAANAAALGMVINESPSYLRLSDGAVIGAGDAAASTSSVDAIGRGAVENSLIVDTPLVTEPEATIQGAPVEEADDATSATPQPITEGLPTPTTR